MTASPPIKWARPPRRSAPGRSVALIAAALVAALAVGCAAPMPPRPSPSLSTAAPSASSVEPPDVSGLLVAAGGALQVSEADVLVPFDGPPAAIVEVVAARDIVVAVDDAGRITWSEPAIAGPRAWRLLDIPANQPPSALIGLSPDGRTIALAAGRMQARSFDLVLLDVASGAARSIDVARGLDGPPIWLAPAVVAIHAIRDDQTSGFSQVDIATGTVADVPSYGVALSASADGRRVAFDEATSGDILVGERTDMNDAGLDRLTRLANPFGAGVDRVALSADGTRLAVARRTDTGTTIELLVEVEEAWRQVGAITIPGERAVSIAWLE